MLKADKTKHQIIIIIVKIIILNPYKRTRIRQIKV